MNNVKFWCAVTSASQLAFDGSVITRDIPVGECHIVFSDVLLCGQGRDKLKELHNARRQKTVQNRVESIPICPKCEKRYKANKSLEWQKWVGAVESQRELPLVRERSS